MAIHGKGKWVREDDWIGRRNEAIASPEHNFLINKDSININKLTDKITKLEQKILYKDRVIEALEKSTPEAHAKLAKDYNNLVDSNNKLLQEKADLDKVCIEILDAHGFTRDFDGLRGLSQAFTNAKNTVSWLTSEKIEIITNLSRSLNDKLKQINLLFDPTASTRPLIDFNVLYNDLKTLLTNQTRSIVDLTNEKNTLTNENLSLVLAKVELNGATSALVGVSLELLEFRTRFLALKEYYERAGLTTVWELTIENMRDLFKLMARGLIDIAQRKLRGEIPKLQSASGIWETDASLNDYITKLQTVYITG